jgi:cell wall-associated NlpC family hydrolase
MLQALEGLLRGWATQDQLRELGTPSAGPSATVTGSLDLSSGYSREMEEDGIRAHIVAFCRAHIGQGYKLGVEVRPGQEDEAGLWDCSELVEAAYRRVGQPLPDGSPYQYEDTKPLPPGDHPKPGDLGFLWNDKWGRIGHVMVATGEGTVVHARAGAGVCEEAKEKYELSPRFRGWRRHHGFVG